MGVEGVMRFHWDGAGQKCALLSGKSRSAQDLYRETSI